MFGEPLYDATLLFTKVTEYGLSLAAFGQAARRPLVPELLTMTFLFAEPSGHYRANRTILALSCLHPSVDALPASQDETLPDKLLVYWFSVNVVFRGAG